MADNKNKKKDIPLEDQQPQECVENETEQQAEQKAEENTATEQQPQDELTKTKEMLLRTAAEYENFRKRSAKEKDAAFNNGVAHASSYILGILDTLELAANAPTQDEEYKKGVVMTLDKAADIFSSLGITEIKALDTPFDPETMSAVMQQPCQEGQQPDQVVQVFQKGYKINDKVIRHATVVVSV